MNKHHRYGHRVLISMYATAVHQANYKLASLPHFSMATEASVAFIYGLYLL